MLKKLGLYYRTIKHLKPVQIRYRLWYALRSRFRSPAHSLNASPNAVKSYPLQLQEWIPKPVSYDNLTFTFLNQSKTFAKPIDWNCSEYGKLWAYYLNYFDYLLQPDMSKEAGALLIGEFIENLHQNREGLEPYPISLRGINWIKFLNQYAVRVHEADASLYAQYRVLLHSLEYHLMGNHLLENGYSLMFGAWYFRDDEMLVKGKEILLAQLEEQVLPDGGHFELSPMYHRILLDRLMDVYNLMINNREWHADATLERRLQETLRKMLGWLKAVSFSNGDIPMVNDSAEDTGPNNPQLFSYAKRLGLKPEPVSLRESGYRKIDAGSAELFLDVGSIGPDYIPGHAHSDTFSFILYHKGKPLIIDPGVSTYENNTTRQKERSTFYHNTVEVNGTSQSEVWGGFRVGRRAYVKNLIEEASNGKISIHAEHSGYDHLGITHQRIYKLYQGKIYINDILKGDKAKWPGKAFLHFAPNINVELLKEKVIVVPGEITIRLNGALQVRMENYKCPAGYNLQVDSPKAVIDFEGELETIIEIN